MINRGDIKLAIDMVVNAQDDNLFGGEAEYVINTLEDCGNTIAAQAAVIEKLREALTACVCAMQDHQAGIGITEIFDRSEELGRKALALPADSTQILDEVRRAERELVAQYVQQGTGDWMLGKKIAEAIRAME